ncbi:MAG: tRNA uridine-5-carboxymethylaminomethyl(34) synthesis GTPase MnmE [Gammaproteobacteria bacterium]|nr:tRNA uridine-5-carboxymethylaminomethyl(34) synthesis GTPase MnmE [Gammaproteobacteria bacterium]
MKPDTIVAAATPPGTGGIAIVRISGPQASEVAEQLVGRLPPPREARHRTFRDAAGAAIDSGIVLYFAAPNSFTGEDVVELQGHGGPMPVAMIVDAAVGAGARLAAPGEFTQRAFLNGRLDLAQAEAVADLISSGTAQAARAALRSLSGEFSKRVVAIAAEIERLRIFVEAAIDFPEEDVDFLSDGELHAAIGRASSALTTLIGQSAVGRVLRDGFRVVIVGKPNAGKSSLMNRLSGEDTAIVTEVAGTTRDILREQIDIDGLAVELVDTAGLRDNPDRIEAEGIRRAREALANADAALWIQDASDGNDSRADLPADLPSIPIIVVRNKIDLTGEAAGANPRAPRTLGVSAATGAGLDELRRQIGELAGYENLGEQTVTARRRHVDALQRAAQHFAAGCRALREDRAGEVFAEELRLAHRALGEITGACSADDLLGRIFSEFCIGK